MGYKTYPNKYGRRPPWYAKNYPVSKSISRKAIQKFGVTHGARKFFIPRNVNARYGGYIGRESKFKDISLNYTVGATLVSRLLLNGIVQGNTQSQRIGNRVVITSIMVRGRYIMPSINPTTSLGTFSNRVLSLIVQDKQPNNATIVGASVLQNAADVDSFNNLDQSNRTRILLHKRYVMLPRYVLTSQSIVDEAMGVGYSINFSFYKKCNIPVQYNGTDALIGSIVTNAIHWMDLLDATTPAITANLVCRIRFTG